MKKKILFIYNEPPVNTSGGNIRVNKLIKSALKKFDVTLLTLPKKRNDLDLKLSQDEFPSLNIVVANIFIEDLFKFNITKWPKILFNRYFWLRLKRLFGNQTKLTKKHYQQIYALRMELEFLLKKESFDIVQVEHSYFANILKGLKIKSKKIIDFHNVHSAMCSLSEKNDFLSEEKYFSKIYDVALVCSKQDSINLEHARFKSLQIISNGVDTEYFKFQEIGELKNVLFVGDLSYAPNKEGALWFVRKISPFLPSKFKTLIIGRKPGKLKKYSSDKIEILGFVDNINNFAKNSVFVVPIKLGGGTRLKILMAASVGMPIITTTKGVEGLNFKENVDLCIANNPFEFVSSIERLEKTDYREKLIKNARRKAETYSWENIGKSYLKILLDQ